MVLEEGSTGRRSVRPAGVPGRRGRQPRSWCLPPGTGGPTRARGDAGPQRRSSSPMPTHRSSPIAVFIPVSANSDYSPLVQRLREFGRHVVGAGADPGRVRLRRLPDLLTRLAHRVTTVGRSGQDIVIALITRRTSGGSASATRTRGRRCPFRTAPCRLTSAPGPAASATSANASLATQGATLRQGRPHPAAARGGPARHPRTCSPRPRSPSTPRTCSRRRPARSDPGMCRSGPAGQSMAVSQASRTGTASGPRVRLTASWACVQADSASASAAVPAALIVTF